ncbi:CPBP family glutamic-type intramembrane protease [Dyella sp. 2RAB6]|uniref:CPBP family glutamic-type intramembrane protease n=1 Tax=Dyella sp. 2RAB6 TaxID=3232992 RepID=UPI003F8DB481
MLRTAGFVLAAALLLLGLRALAGWMLESHLRHEAEGEQHTLQAGEPLWRWRLLQPRDLVAGRPFGNATVQADRMGLKLSSRDGQAFELGLPVLQPIDLAHWPLLRLSMRSSTPGALSLVVQPHAQEPSCMAETGAIPVGDATSLVLDLRKLDWRHGDGSPCALPATVAYLFRLRPRLPAGQTLELREAALVADPPVRLPGPTPTVDLSAGREIDLLEQLTVAPSIPAVPLVWLPREGSVESWLALRDRLRGLWPAALIVPAGAVPVAAAHEAAPAWLGWLICAVYLLLLLYSARRKTHPTWDVVAVAAGPLWLIAGLQWGLHASPPAVTAFVGALAWAGWREMQRRPAEWHWAGGKTADWLMPFALLPLALILAAVFGHGFAAPEWRHAFLYVAWAGLQQWLMLAVVLRRLERWPAGTALPILGAAALFALLHTPNAALMQLCFLAELWWAWCFLRSRRLLPIALAHAGCALLVESSLTGGVLRSLEVSARFFL